jgi:hypothetical protein
MANSEIASSISGFRLDVCDICAPMGCYAALSGGSVLAFLHNLSVQSSRVKMSWTSWPLKMGRISCQEKSVRNYHPTLRNIPEESRSEVASCQKSITGLSLESLLTDRCNLLLHLFHPHQSHGEWNTDVCMPNEAGIVGICCVLPLINRLN